MPNDAAAGYLDLLLLATVRSKPGHGYEIAQELRRKSRGEFDLNDGTIYPALHRLEEDGLLTSHWDEVQGRRRRVYEVTTAGRRALGERQADWLRYTAAMQEVLGS